MPGTTEWWSMTKWSTHEVLIWFDIITSNDLLKTRVIKTIIVLRAIKLSSKHNCWAEILWITDLETRDKVMS